jgi:hypothetical protein
MKNMVTTALCFYLAGSVSFIVGSVLMLVNHIKSN